MHSHLRWIILCLLAAAFLTLAACGDDEKAETSTGEFDGTIKIGLITDLTGPGFIGPITLSIDRGIELGVEDVNTNGGVEVGGKRYRLELLVRDTRSEPVAMAAAAQEMIQQRVFAAHIGSPINFDAGYQQLKEAGILVFSQLPNATFHLINPQEGPGANPLLFSPIENFDQIVRNWQAQIHELYPALKSVGGLHINDPLGQLLAGSVERGANDTGMEFRGVSFGPIGTTDWSTFITNIKAKNPDLLHIWGGGGHQEAVDQSIKLDPARYIWAELLRVADIERFGPLGDHIVIATNFRLPFTKDLVPDKYRSAVQRLGDLPGGLAIEQGFFIAYFDFIHILDQAIEKTGTTTDSRAVAGALIGQTYTGPFGKAEVQKDHTTSGQTGTIVATKDEFIFYLYPDVGVVKPSETYRFPRTD